MRKLIFLAVALLMTLGFVNGIWQKDDLPISNLESPKESVLRISHSPGTQYIYDLDLESMVSFATDQRADHESFQVKGTLHVRVHQHDDDATLYGISLKNYIQTQNDGERVSQKEETGELYVLSRAGKIEEFVSAEFSDPLAKEALKAIALAMQVALPEQRIMTVGQVWWGWEKARQGQLEVKYQSQKREQRFDVHKDFIFLQNANGLSLGQGSRADMAFDLRAGHLLKLSQDLSMSTKGQGVDIDSRSFLHLTFRGQDKISLPLLSYRELKSRLTVTVEAVGDQPKLTKEQKQVQYQRILGGMTGTQLLALLRDLGSLDDQRLPDLYDRLVAKLFLDKEFAKHLLLALQDPTDTKNFEIQLNVVMGALSTMKAEDIETEILDYSRTHTESDLIMQQVSFALADLQGASSDVFEFLENLTLSENKDIATVGYLSLGSLARQDIHSDSVMEILHKELKNAKPGEELVYIAALGNMRHQGNLEVFSRFASHEDVSLASQAVYALKHVKGDEAFELLRQRITGDSRDDVLIQGIRALSGHYDREECGPILREILAKPHSDKVYMEALAILAGFKDRDRNVKTDLQQLVEQGRYSPAVTDFIEDLLLTI